MTPHRYQLLAAGIAVGVLLARCGGSSTQPQVQQEQHDAVRFAVCMRSHGVPDYPDPHISGSSNHVQITISPGSADPNSPVFGSAGHACHNLLPDGGMPANGAQDQAQDLTFANCMRSHGVPNFPDADHDGAFTLPSTIDEQAPQFQHATQACMSMQPSSLSINQRPANS
jgi:hypothetical protein